MQDTIENEVPEWVQDTPPEDTYFLCMYGASDNEPAQNIDMTREEYIDLKAALARMRGAVPLDKPATGASAKSSPPSDDDIAAILKRVTATPDALSLVRATLDAFDGDDGSITPAEEFVTSILSRYLVGHLTPEIAERQVADFRSDFEDMCRRTNHFARLYPAEVAAYRKEEQGNADR